MSETTPEQARALLMAAFKEDEEMRAGRDSTLLTKEHRMDRLLAEELDLIPRRQQRHRDNGR